MLGLTEGETQGWGRCDQVRCKRSGKLSLKGFLLASSAHGEGRKKEKGWRFHLEVWIARLRG